MIYPCCIRLRHERQEENSVDQDQVAHTEPPQHVCQFNSFFFIVWCLSSKEKFYVIWYFTYLSGVRGEDYS